MEQRLSLITLGVEDLPAMRQFYTDTLGWQPVAANKDIVFFKLNGLLLSLYSRAQLADFVGLSAPGSQSGFRGFTLAYNVPSDEQVRALYGHLAGEGVRILREPLAPPFGGLLFCFADPEGNVWEVAHNPYIPLDGQGNAITHHPIDHL
jgi:hypothetical protein